MTGAPNPLVIGVTGSFGAGCSSVVRYLERQHGFTRFSLSSIPRDLAAEEGHGKFGDHLTATQREFLQDYGDMLRREKGRGYMAAECIAKIQPLLGSEQGREFVIDSIRHPSEVAAFRAAFPRFCLIAVYAPRSCRWERSRRLFDGNEDRFDVADERDSGDDQPDFGQNVQGCVDQADILINNEVEWATPGEHRRFEARIDTYITLARNPGSRIPRWPELYMGQAYAASLRSTCCKRRVGAAIVRDIGSLAGRRVANTGGNPIGLGTHDDVCFLVATGYNDAPPGMQSCLECGASRDYCDKDEQVVALLMTMKFCPNCGVELVFPREEKVRPSFQCPRCRKAIAKAYSAGRQLDVCRALHAEEMAILQSANLGSSALNETVLYTTTFPCLLCAKKIIQVGIKEVVFAEPYPMKQAVESLTQAGVRLQRFEGVTARAYFRLFQG